MSIHMPQPGGTYHLEVTYHGQAKEMLALLNTAEELDLHANLEAATSRAASLTVRESGKSAALSDLLRKAGKLHEEADRRGLI